MNSENEIKRIQQLIQIFRSMKTSDKVSIIAAVIAFTSMSISVIQNVVAAHLAEEQERIRAAIAISRDYLKHRSDMFENNKLIGSENTIRTLEYIAYLSNKKLISRSYVAFQLKCDIRKVCEQENEVPDKIKPIACIENFAQIVKGCPGENLAMCQSASPDCTRDQ